MRSNKRKPGRSSLLSGRKEMASSHRRKREVFRQGDGGLVVIIMILLLLGIIMVYSASGILAEKLYQDSTHFLKKQFVWIGLGTLLFLVSSRLPLRWLRAWIIPMLCCIITLLGAVLLVGVKINGSQRWLQIGSMAFQSSEAAKLFTVIYLAHYIAKKGKRIRDFSDGLAPALAVIGVVAGLILVEPDFGTTAMIVLISFLLLFLGGASLLHLLPIGGLTIPFFIYWVMKAPYRLQRVKTFLNPWQDPSSSGFQMIQSYVALGSGGLVGTGLGEGRQKFFFLPEPHTDFIFAVIGEELGLFGTVSILFLFVFLLWKGTRIALSLDDPFTRMLAIGTTLMMTLPALINMGVVTGLLPTKGLPLPFVSYGGSSLLVNSIAVGLLYNTSRFSESPSISRLRYKGRRAG
ncbi:MAG TPA: putative lipid II flippase FtsW [Nitrospiria bacterium]|nr:putative lipid II flippase FtsW [Candidatus Manganitrophaceae bacterium]HIL33808.1 putative lipid II flippase FtsW [Candidatus Manganitrophaceae bacterium]